MGIGDLNVHTTDVPDELKFGVNSLEECYCNTQIAGLHISNFTALSGISKHGCPHTSKSKTYYHRYMGIHTLYLH
jgi:hypothetical protein